jgi:DNA-binding MarR family transcriptional regulator
MSARTATVHRSHFVNTQEDDEKSQGATRRLSTNLARILREFSRDFDRRVTHKLRERGHRDFSLSHQVVFANMGLGRTRVTELAERARITQQAMGKTLRELESLGYIERSVDPSDRRARSIRLTPRGIQLVDDAVSCCEEVRQEYAGKIGERELDELEERLRSAASRLELDYLPTSWAEPGGR